MCIHCQCEQFYFLLRVSLAIVVHNQYDSVVCVCGQIFIVFVWSLPAISTQINRTKILNDCPKSIWENPISLITVDSTFNCEQIFPNELDPLTVESLMWTQKDNHMFEHIFQANRNENKKKTNRKIDAKHFFYLNSISLSFFSIYFHFKGLPNQTSPPKHRRKLSPAEIESILFSKLNSHIIRKYAESACIVCAVRTMQINNHNSCFDSIEYRNNFELDINFP